MEGGDLIPKAKPNPGTAAFRNAATQRLHEPFDPGPTNVRPSWLLEHETQRLPVCGIQCKISLDDITSNAAPLLNLSIRDCPIDTVQSASCFRA